MAQVTDASRRARGLRLIRFWVPEAYVERLKTLCADSGYTSTGQLLAMIDRELKDLEERKKRLKPTPKPRRRR